jgi:hypothetical protein
MAHKVWIAALGMIAATPLSATHPVPIPATAVPSGTDVDGQPIYCLRVEPATGSRIETVQCWPLDVWVEAGVDVNKDWAKNGVVERPPTSPLG